MRRDSYTIQTLLEEMKTSLPPFRKGMIFETLKSIYPSSLMDKKRKNITVNGKTFTKPLSCNRKDKENFFKERSPVADFFLENTRGDFLEIVDIKGKYALCINRSMKKETLDTYYKNEYVAISQDNLINGDVKIYRRKIDKFFNNKEY